MRCLRSDFTAGKMFQCRGPTRTFLNRKSERPIGLQRKVIFVTAETIWRGNPPPPRPTLCLWWATCLFPSLFWKGGLEKGRHVAQLQQTEGGDWGSLQSQNFQTDSDVANTHSWAQRKLSPFSLLNILLSINSPLLFSDLTDLTINGCNLQKFNDQAFDS